MIIIIVKGFKNLKKSPSQSVCEDSVLHTVHNTNQVVGVSRGYS